MPLHLSFDMRSANMANSLDYFKLIEKVML